MQCRGNFKFRGLQHVDAGKFVNGDGEEIPYKESYKLKVDEVTGEGVKELVFKIAPDSVLIPKLREMKIYEDIQLLFDVLIYSSGSRVVPVGIIK